MKRQQIHTPAIVQNTLKTSEFFVLFFSKRSYHPIRPSMSLLHCCYHYHCWNWSVVIFFCTLFSFFKKKKRNKKKISLPSFNPPDCLAVHQHQNQGLSRLLQRPIQHHPIKYFFLDYPIVPSFFLLRPLCLLTLFFLSPRSIPL